jgi:predicted unusual protein kinase regulating ubiquinone biosynthesis (AarF/ABC1/UbiB family)
MRFHSVLPPRASAALLAQTSARSASTGKQWTEQWTAYRKTALELGVLLIKLGQFLSSRADLLPQRALDVLSSLQDEVPPAPFSHIESVLESELHRPMAELFASIEPEATAPLARPGPSSDFADQPWWRSVQRRTSTSLWKWTSARFAS